MSTFLQVQAQKMTLSGSGAIATATSVVLSSMKQIDGSTSLTMADFGSIGHGVLEPGTSREEAISFAGITQNANGTATLTGVTRGLKFVSDYTQDTALRSAHAGGTIFIITNSAAYYSEFVTKRNAETISGIKTFSATPKTSAGNPLADTDLASKKYVDDTTNGGAVSHNTLIVAGTAGETITTGQLVYFDATDNEWKLTDADTTTTVNNVLLGIAQGAGTNGNAITGGVLLIGTDSNQSGMTPGDTMYAGNTAGAIASSAGTTEVEVGIAKSATELYFAPRYASTPTASEIDALAGTSGTPSSTNKFVTDDGLNISINEETANYTLVLGDRLKLIDMNKASAVTLTVPPNASVAFPTGTKIYVRQKGAGKVTIAEGAAVTINSAGSVLDLKYQYSVVTLVKVASDTWNLEGELDLTHSDVTGSRAIGTIYQNTSGRIMMALICVTVGTTDAAGSTASVVGEVENATPPTVDFGTVENTGQRGAATSLSIKGIITLVIPVNDYYKVTSTVANGGAATLVSWIEVLI